MRASVHLLALLCLVPLGGVRADEAPEIAVVMHPSASTGMKLDRSTLTQIFTLTRRSWPDGQPILVFNLSAQSPVRHTFDRVVLGMSPQEVGRFWINAAVRGHGRPPRQVAEPKVLVRLVAAFKNGIGYVPAETVDASVRVVARIKGGQLVAP